MDNMFKTNFTANFTQWKSLEALAYWTADREYLKEKYGADDPEVAVARGHSVDMVRELNELDVPKWVQSAVMTWAEDWRAYVEQYMDTALRRMGYDISRG